MKYVFMSHGYLAGGHSDFDAVGSLASLVRFAKKRRLIYNKDYYICMVDYFQNGLNVLRNYHNSIIIIADIPPEVLLTHYKHKGFIDFFKGLRFNNNRIVFIDHHSCNDNIITFLRNLKYRGLFDYIDFYDVNYNRDRLIPLDKKLCATERVQKYLFKFKLIRDDGIFFKLRVFAHDQDFGIRKIEEAFDITQVIGSDYNNERLIHLLSDGIFWNDELEKVKNDHINLTNELCSKIKIKLFENYHYINNNKIKKNVVYALMPDDSRLKTSAAAVHIYKHYDCSYVVLLHRYPFFSIRVPINEHDISAAKITGLFGGGGHYGAASASKKNIRGKFPFPYEFVNENNFEEVANNINITICNNYRE